MRINKSACISIDDGDIYVVLSRINIQLNDKNDQRLEFKKNVLNAYRNFTILIQIYLINVSDNIIFICSYDSAELCSR